MILASRRVPGDNGSKPASVSLSLAMVSRVALSCIQAGTGVLPRGSRSFREGCTAASCAPGFLNARLNGGRLCASLAVRLHTSGRSAQAGLPFLMDTVTDSDLDFGHEHTS